MINIITQKGSIYWDMAEFNIFGAATKDSIRVGYIDPDRGYISSNSIYDANLYLGGPGFGGFIGASHRFLRQPFSDDCFWGQTRRYKA